MTASVRSDPFCPRCGSPLLYIERSILETVMPVVGVLGVVNEVTNDSFFSPECVEDSGRETVTEVLERFLKCSREGCFYAFGGNQLGETNMIPHTPPADSPSE